MSALAGIYNFDGAPVDPELISALGSALDPWGPDGGDEICAGPAGMAYRAFHTTRESRQECQPLVSDQGHILTWDGRIDNRKELIDLLRGLLLEQPTDADIAMAVCKKWGADGIVKIIGDFALAWIDKNNRTLLLARDAIGTRTLYYHANKDRIFFSSTIEPILDLSGITVEVDEEYIADYLATQTPGMKRTPYTGIYAVEPGHVVIARNDQLSSHRHWSPDPNKEIRYQTDAEYEEHFLHLFKQAVKAPLCRSNRPVWAELSGGLDSTSIVCMADRLVEEGEITIPKPKTISHFTEATIKTDEGKYIRWVEEQRRITGFHQRYDEFVMSFANPEERFQGCLTPGLLCYDGIVSLHQELIKNDVRIILSGHGGDQMLWAIDSAAPELTNLLYQRKLKQLHFRLKACGRIFNKPYITLLWQEAIVPLLPTNLRARFQGNIAKPPAWLSATFVKRMGIRSRNPLPNDPFGYRLPGERIRSGYIMKAIEIAANGGYRGIRHIETTYPFLHRPLIDFLIAVPFDQLMRDGVKRSLQRRALRDIVYPKILRRKYKGSIEDGTMRGIHREWPILESMFTEALSCERGYVNSKAIQTALALARHGGKASSVQLMFTISLELWLRSVSHYYLASKRYGHARCE
jgi:asparagine synthase (glutamine-hydrolysing)